MDGQTDGWTDGRTDGWMDGRMDGRTENLPILQDFDPYRGCCLKRRADFLNKWPQ